MKLGFIILAHNQPDAVRRLVDVLAGAGHRVVIHFDKKAPAAQQEAVRSLEQAYPALVRVVSKVHCVWGEWSLVEAVLVALREFERMPEKPDYIHLMSGVDFPIRPIADLQEFLRRNPAKDFIECCDITQRKWVKGGLSIERFKFFFPVNFRTSRKTFDRLVRWHRKLKIRRKIPLDMTPHMGSQWWTLRWSSCASILDFLRQHPRVRRYFRSTWIPDEAFFQTVLAHLIPRHEIADLQLILHHLTPSGRPYIIYPDHLPLVRKLPHFFVRKVASSALDGIEALARSRRSPIPRPSQLARVRDLVRPAIDRNYEHHASVPGHPQGDPPAGPPKTVLIFLTESPAETMLIRAHARSHPAASWCGRPFASDCIDLSDEMYASTGLTRKMTAVRSMFPDQFADILAAALPQDKIAVIAFQKGDTGGDTAMLARIPGSHFAAIRPFAFFHVICPDLIHEVPARRIRRCLDERSSTLPSMDSPAEVPQIEVRQFGRNGNYFHFDAVIQIEEGTLFKPTFILPGITEPVRPESVFTRRQPSGSVRVLLFFWVDDGAFAPISAANPAHLLLNVDASAVPPPHPLCELRESTEEDLVHMLDSFDEPAACSADRQVPTVEDAAASCQRARDSIQSRKLPRKEVLATIQSCLPRDSKWWVTALSAEHYYLGDEQVADALNSMGTAASQQNKADFAELCFTAARLIHPPAQSIAWNLGLLLASQGRNKEAEDCFHGVRRHYSNESISTCWPTREHSAWPSTPWPVDGFSLPDGITSWPRISIVTPSYNQGHFIEETILSILNQHYPNLQYIVVDGNSTDDTKEVLERYRSRIDHLIIEPDDGQTQAINKGFRLADGEIIAWLNSDDMYGPGTLHQVALHWLKSRADVLSGICSEHTNHTFRVINKPSATNRDFNPAQLARIFPYWFSGMYFFQPEVFFTKALLDRVGMLDESLHYAMDYDLWMRFAKEGAQLEVIDWPFAFFRLHDAQKTTQSALCIAEQCAVRNRHHPLELREERKQQIDRQLAVLSAKKKPTIAVFGTHFESVITQAAALPQTDPLLIFPASAKDPVLSTADAVIVLIGSQRQEISLIQQLRTADPDLLIVGWFLDHDHNPHANYDAALLVDIIFPTDSSTGDYLRHDAALMGLAVQPDAIHTMISFLVPRSSHSHKT